MLAGVAALACSCSKAPPPKPEAKPKATAILLNQYPGSLDWSGTLFKTTLEVRRTFVQSNTVAVAEVSFDDLDEQAGKATAKFSSTFAEFLLEITPDQESQLLKGGALSSWIIAAKITDIKRSHRASDNVLTERTVEGICLNIKPIKSNVH